MTKKRILIMTGANESMLPVLDLTLPSKAKYAQKHGYDFLTMRSFKGYPEFKLAEGLSTHWIGFSRAMSVFDMINYYDIVAWIDGDAIITNDSIKIEDITSDNHTLYFSLDWCVSKDLTTINKNFSSGNFILQDTGTDRLTAVYSTFVQASEHYRNDAGSEQSCFNAIYNHTPLRHEFSVLDHSYLNAVPEFVMRTNTWRSDERRGKPDFRIESPWNEDCFLAHLTGCSNDDRLDLLQNELKQYTK